MKCVLIFDHLNDVIFAKYDNDFALHITKIAKTQGLIEQNEDVGDVHRINSNIIMQIFSPITTSQRIMNCQFGNSYTSIQCQDGLNIIFNEFMGYLFMEIGTQSVGMLKRSLGVCISFVRHLCGPDIYLLKSNESSKVLLSRLLSVWQTLRGNDQSILVEAVEQLMVNADLGSATLKSLQEVIDKLKTQHDTNRAHAMVLVQNKFMSLYSSRNANDLSPADIIFISLLTALSSKNNPTENKDDFINLSSGSIKPNLSSPSKILDEKVETYNTLLMGNGVIPSCIPNTIHIIPITEEIRLVLLIEIGNNTVSSGIYEIFHNFNNMQTVQLQKNTEAMKPALDNLDNSIKKVLEQLKKMKNLSHDLDNCQRKFQSKWDMIRKKYLEFLKTSDPDCVLSIESNTGTFMDSLRELMQLAVLDSVTNMGSTNGNIDDCIGDFAKIVHDRLTNFTDFLQVKAKRNFTLGSRSSLTINKYLEEFPGLVHFLYIDRTNHRITAPSLDFTSEETLSLTKQKIWSMVDFAQAHLEQGNLAFMWKDTTFNYAYFLWFEDAAGSPLKPKVFPSTPGKVLPIPGILATDFYKKLVEICFPKQATSKIRCFELFCIHLGLATSSCVLEHTRRLAATIWDVTGVPNNPIDLL